MPEKVKHVTDPWYGVNTGVDRIKWVQFDGAYFPRRGGKAVMRAANDLYYRNADANSSTLAGFLEADSVGNSQGHPVSPSTGDKLPVNFGIDKTCVFPTTGRVPVATDVGRTFAIWNDALQTQHCNLNGASPTGVLQVVQVMTDGTEFGNNAVVCKIPEARRWGNLA
jgi:hypothetical protein